MQSQRISYLLDRYIRSQLTEAEQQELAKLLQDPEQEKLIQDELARLLQEEAKAEAPADPQNSWQPVLQQIFSVDRTAETAIVRPLAAQWLRWGAAAAIL